MPPNCGHLGQCSNATYLFKHALVRDAAYESLLKSRRLTLYARLLEVLETRDDGAPEVKAQHAEAAGLTERALDYWEQAGAQALARPAYKEAIASLRKWNTGVPHVGERATMDEA